MCVCVCVCVCVCLENYLTQPNNLHHYYKYLTHLFALSILFVDYATKVEKNINQQRMRRKNDMKNKFLLWDEWEKFQR